MGIIPPQYSLLMAVGRFRRKRGVGVTAVAPLLHVSSAFVATETGKLAKTVRRASDSATRPARPPDWRAWSQIRPAPSNATTPEIRAINDIFFGVLTPSNLRSYPR